MGYNMIFGQALVDQHASNLPLVFYVDFGSFTLLLVAAKYPLDRTGWKPQM